MCVIPRPRFALALRIVCLSVLLCQLQEQENEQRRAGGRTKKEQNNPPPQNSCTEQNTMSSRVLGRRVTVTAK